MFHARAWTAQEVEVLLDIWQDPIIRETLASARDPLDGCTQISDTMGDSGYVVRLKSRSHIPTRLNSPGYQLHRENWENGPRNSLSGNSLRKFGNFAKTLGSWFAQVVNSLKKHLSSQFCVCNSHNTCKLAQGKFAVRQVI